ncbi:acyl carrier protein, partial [Streptomyces thermovulgaris]
MRLLTEVLADVVGVEQVSADHHFFHDLGADSLVMARFCARVRKRADLPSVSMKDVYRHPTVESLAAALTGPGATAPAPAPPTAATGAATTDGTPVTSASTATVPPSGAPAPASAADAARAAD